MPSAKTNAMKTLIRNASVVLPEGTLQTSVLIDGGQIAAIDPAIHTQAETVVDAAGLHLIPGVIDDQVHFREPGLTHKEDLRHASRACAKGGVTTFLDMPNTTPNTTTQTRLDEKLTLAAQRSLVNYGFYIGATPDNLEELKQAQRTPGIKIFIGSSTGDLLVDDQDALERIFGETSLPICAHCEDESIVRANQRRYAASHDVADHSRIRDREAAVVSTCRALDLAFRHQHRFHVLHVSTGAEADLAADHRGLITAEVCPHHLFFSIDDYPRLGTLVQMNPSVKTKADGAHLWQALLDGRVQVVATDHAPHARTDKEVEFEYASSGISGLETSLALSIALVNEGVITWDKLAEKMSSNPARILSLSKGTLAPGADADITVIDPQVKWTVNVKDFRSRGKNSPFGGRSLQGRALLTIVGGEIKYCAPSFKL